MNKAKDSSIKPFENVLFSILIALLPTSALAESRPKIQVSPVEANQKLLSKPAAGLVAVLQGLDKITARVSVIYAPIGTEVRMGALEIIVRRCDKRPPTETPETTAYLEIRERHQDEEAAKLFAGWMFASSPAASAMEHPVYDLWVVDCKNVSSSSLVSSSGKVEEQSSADANSWRNPDRGISTAPNWDR